MGQETCPPRIMRLVYCSCIFVCKLNKASGSFLSYEPGLRGWRILTLCRAVGPGHCTPRNHAGLLTGPRGGQGPLSKGKGALERHLTLLTVSPHRPSGCAPQLTFSLRAREGGTVCADRAPRPCCCALLIPLLVGLRAEKRCV